MKNKNVLVYGLSVSGEWAAKLLVKKKANVFLFDDNAEVLAKKNIKNCYVLKELNENYISQFDFIVVSPSIDKENTHIKTAEKYGIKVYSEIEFASWFASKIVAVTGTNGKTTTVKLITELLQSKKKAIACGNIGFPLSRAVIESKKSIKVAEVSSFMLEHIYKFKPQVATITNIEQDHLIRHKTMEEYSNLKKKIFQNQTCKDYAVVNLDNRNNCDTLAKVITYSYSKMADVSVRGGAIYLFDKKIVALNELKIKGKHNIYNAMCAICFAHIYKVKPQKMRDVLINFRGDKYRAEITAKHNNITYINDSKSTNIASTLACVDAIKGAIILLLGGSNKELNYVPLFSRLSKRVKHIVAYGEIAPVLVSNNDNKFKIDMCQTLDEAIKIATENAKSGDSVVLSPATASYDQYENYIERGKHFDALVQKHIKNENEAKQT